MTLTPAYGRDYKTKKDAETAFNEGADFVIADIMHPYSGSYCNKEDLVGAGERTVKIRFKNLTEVTVIKVA